MGGGVMDESVFVTDLGMDWIFDSVSVISAYEGLGKDSVLNKVKAIIMESIIYDATISVYWCSKDSVNKYGNSVSIFSGIMS